MLIHQLSQRILHVRINLFLTSLSIVMESSSSGNDTLPSKVQCKCQIHAQIYLGKWENYFKFKGWLSKSKKGPEHFHWISCNTNGKARKSRIEKHADEKKHKKSGVQIIKISRSVLDMSSVNARRKEAQVKEGEIRLIAFLNEHNFPHSAIDHLVPTAKAACSDSDIAKSFKCGRNKLTAVVKNVLGGEVKGNIYELFTYN